MTSRENKAGEQILPDFTAYCDKSVKHSAMPEDSYTITSHLIFGKVASTMIPFKFSIDQNALYKSMN